MKAMVFAAGRGTRLGSLTEARPKALVEIEGVPLIEIVLLRLREAGVSQVVVNLHHFGGQIEAFLAAKKNFTLDIAFSREKELLDTGGGLRNASWFFDDDGPFLVHNVDVLSDIDLPAAMRAHKKSAALATLIALPRPTSRPLLFDADGFLCGRASAPGDTLVRTPRGELRRLGFCGIHVISPALFERMTERGAFSIIESYLRLAGERANISVFSPEDARWRDAGRPQDLQPL